MAEYLASIFGTEKDKVNCSFYFKIGACRHGDKCSRIHNRPTFSQTILLQNLYQNPKLDIHRAEAMLNVGVSDAEEQQHFDEFFEEIFTELEDKYGEIEEMNVCDNIGEHMIGNVYVKFKREEDAEKAAQAVNNRWFNGMPVYAELSPVTDFREACCRQYEMGECTRGGFCNFMHLKPISYELRRELYNRDHPWRSLNDDTDQDGEVEKKKRRSPTTVKKRRKRKKQLATSTNSAKNRFTNGLNEFYAHLNATSSTNQTNNNLINSTNDVGTTGVTETTSPAVAAKTMKKRRKIVRRRKNKIDTHSTELLPAAYQRAQCFSSSSSESSADSSSSPTHTSSRCRLPSPFRDLFLSKQRRIAANGSSSTVATVVPLGEDLVHKVVVADDDVDDIEKSCVKGESDCGKGGFCNFMHLKPISRELRRKLYGRKRHSSPSRASGRYGQGGPGERGPNDVTSSRRRSRTRSRSPDRRGGGGDRGGDRDRGRRNRY